VIWGDLMVEGLRLMGIGMGIVFAFLFLLVGLLRLMSFAVLRLSPAPPPSVESHAIPAPPSADPALMAVIGAAVHRYRRNHMRRGP